MYNINYLGNTCMYGLGRLYKYNFDENEAKNFAKKLSQDFLNLSDEEETSLQDIIYATLSAIKLGCELKDTKIMMIKFIECNLSSNINDYTYKAIIRGIDRFLDNNTKQIR